MFTQLMQNRRNNQELGAFGFAPIFEDWWTNVRPLYPQAKEAWGATDVWEHKDRYEISVDLPGASEKDIRVEYTDGELTLEAHRGEEFKGEGEGSATGEHVDESRPSVVIQERRNQKFKRVFSLGDSVNGEKIEGRYRDGVLTVTIPKAEKVQPRTIPIKISA